MIAFLRSVSRCFHDGRCSSEKLQEAVRSSRAAVLFLWDSAPWEPESILLATCSAVGPPDGASTARHLPTPGILDPARQLMAVWADRSLGAAPPLPVDGETLMQELDLAAGPRLGGILREVRLAWEAGEVTTAGEALSLAKTLLERA
jgi:hypothetical protein